MREPWLTKKELAVELKVSVRTIERHQIPATIRVGGQNRYLLSEVERHLRGESAAGGEVIELRPRVIA